MQKYFRDIIGLNVCGINFEQSFSVHGSGRQEERREGGPG